MKSTEISLDTTIKEMAEALDLMLETRQDLLREIENEPGYNPMNYDFTAEAREEHYKACYDFAKATKTVQTLLEPEPTIYNIETTVLSWLKKGPLTPDELNKQRLLVQGTQPTAPQIMQAAWNLIDKGEAEFTDDWKLKLCD